MHISWMKASSKYFRFLRMNEDANRGHSDMLLSMEAKRSLKRLKVADRLSFGAADGSVNNLPLLIG
jgi:hypothetical protein